MQSPLRYNLIIIIDNVWRDRIHSIDYGFNAVYKR